MSENSVNGNKSCKPQNYNWPAWLPGLIIKIQFLDTHCIRLKCKFLYDPQLWQCSGTSMSATPQLPSPFAPSIKLNWSASHIWISIGLFVCIWFDIFACSSQVVVLVIGMAVLHMIPRIVDRRYSVHSVGSSSSTSLPSSSKHIQHCRGLRKKLKCWENPNNLELFALLKSNKLWAQVYLGYAHFHFMTGWPMVG